MSSHTHRDRKTPALIRALHALADRWDKAADDCLHEHERMLAKQHVIELRALLPANEPYAIRHWRQREGTDG